MIKQYTLVRSISVLKYFLAAGLFFILTTPTVQSGTSLVITSALTASINTGSNYPESSSAYVIRTNGASPWFEASNLPSGFFINRTNGVIYGRTDVPGIYSIPISVTANFQTVSATLTFTIKAITERAFTVTNLSNNINQTGSLSWAVNQASQSVIPARINFNISSAQEGEPPYHIQLADRLWINEQMTIDGTTQPGYSGAPLIQIDVNGKVNAFTVVSADQWHHGGSGSIIAGLQIFNFKANAIATQPGANNVTIRDNYLGFYWDVTNNRWWRNFEATLTENQIQNESSPIYNDYTQAVGLGIQSSDNRIERNVISGVHNGISIGYDFESLASDTWGPACWNNVITSNLIGTTPDGTKILTNTVGATLYRPGPQTDSNPFGAPNYWKFFGNNSDGIYLAALVKGTIISHNVSSGNFSVGIELLHESVERNQVYGNRLGTNISGEDILPNGELGIILSNGAHDNLVGGENGPNIVAGNFFAGIELGGANSFRRASYNTIQGNLIGCNVDCTRALGRQTTGIHLGTADSRMNVIEGNTVVGNDWGIYLDGANDNVINNNYIGVTRTGKVIGNAKTGIALDNAFWNTVILNRVSNNGYGISGHEDWSFGIWELNGARSNSYYENSISGNRTETNTQQAALPSSVIVYPTQSIFITCIELDGNGYRGHFSKTGSGGFGPETLWDLNMQSVETLTNISPNCMHFTSTFTIEPINTLTIGNSLNNFALDFIPKSKSDPYYWHLR